MVVCSIATGIPLAGSHADERSDTEGEWGHTETVAAPGPARFELSAGAQAFSHAWSLYSGVTAAPSGLGADGLRVRASAGYGAYSYSGRRPVGVGPETVTFHGVTTFGELLIGYQKQLGPVIVKGFAGLAAADHVLSPDDPETTIRGRSLGGKAALETWWTISDRTWSSFDVSWASVHDSYAARARLGWRLLPELSAGLEAGAAGNLEGDAARLGGFLRYEWPGGELSASGGWSSDGVLQAIQGNALTRSSTPFGTFSWLTRF